MENGRDQCSLDWRFDLSRVKDAIQKDELDKRRCANERLPGFSAVLPGCFSAVQIGKIEGSGLGMRLPESQQGYRDLNRRCRERQNQYHTLDSRVRTTHEGRHLFVSRRSIRMHDLAMIPAYVKDAESELEYSYEDHLNLLGIENWVFRGDRSMLLPRHVRVQTVAREVQ
ncbi:uncharacterized protein LOC135947957 [Cloeon dipterum]